MLKMFGDRLEREWLYCCEDKLRWVAGVDEKIILQSDLHKVAGHIKRLYQNGRVRRGEANLRINGWDERDYRLWSDIRGLPSYGLIAGDVENPMISRKEVIRLMNVAAERRFAKRKERE